jgi:hypothetical protein
VQRKETEVNQRQVTPYKVGTVASRGEIFSETTSNGEAQLAWDFVLCLVQPSG